MAKKVSLSGMNQSELENKIRDLQSSYFKMRCDHAIGTLTSFAEMKKVRKEIARAKTFYNQLAGSNQNGK